MIGSKDGKNFISSVVSDDLLSEAISWIASNLEPEDVFSEQQLSEWAIENDFSKDL